MLYFAHDDFRILAIAKAKSGTFRKSNAVGIPVCRSLSGFYANSRLCAGKVEQSAKRVDWSLLKSVALKFDKLMNFPIDSNHFGILDFVSYGHFLAPFMFGVGITIK